jgi:hypothetical protein
MLSHDIGLTFVTVGSVVYFADKGKKNRSVSVPVGGIRLPDDFVFSLFIIYTAELCTVFCDRDFEILILDGLQFALPPVFCSDRKRAENCIRRILLQYTLARGKNKSISCIAMQEEKR